MVFVMKNVLELGKQGSKVLCRSYLANFKYRRVLRATLSLQLHKTLQDRNYLHFTLKETERSAAAARRARCQTEIRTKSPDLKIRVLPTTHLLAAWGMVMRKLQSPKRQCAPSAQPSSPAPHHLCCGRTCGGRQSQRTPRPPVQRKGSQGLTHL